MFSQDTEVILLSVSLRNFLSVTFTVTFERQKKEMHNYCHLFPSRSPIMLLPKTAHDVLCSDTLKFHPSAWPWLEERAWEAG